MFHPGNPENKAMKNKLMFFSTKKDSPGPENKTIKLDVFSTIFLKTHSVVDNDPMDDVAVTKHVLLALAGDDIYIMMSVCLSVCL